MLPPVSSLFAAVLGVNPVQHLLAASGALPSLPATSRFTRQFMSGRPMPLRSASRMPRATSW